MDIKEQVEAALEEVRPMLIRDGGNVELIDVNSDGMVLVRLHGACSGCPSANVTLRESIQKSVMEKVPSIKGVMAI